MLEIKAYTRSLIAPHTDIMHKKPPPKPSGRRTPQHAVTNLHGPLDAVATLKLKDTTSDASETQA